jgi:hypothetical protein
LKASGIGSAAFWNHAGTLLSHRLWQEFQKRHRQQPAAKRPVAGFMIEAFAERFQGLITRNAKDSRIIAPTLLLVESE